MWIRNEISKNIKKISIIYIIKDNLYKLIYILNIVNMVFTLMDGYLEYIGNKYEYDKTYVKRISLIKLKFTKIYKIANKLFDIFYDNLLKNNTKYKFRYYSVNDWIFNQEKVQINLKKIESLLNPTNVNDVNFYNYNSFMLNNIPNLLGYCLSELHKQKILYNIYSLYEYLSL